MSSVTVFFVTQILASGYACWRGGAPERIAAVLLLLATLATALVPHDHATSYHSVYWAVVWVDIGLLVSLATVALFADRYWPLWMAALQSVALGAHGVKGYDHAVLAIAYWLIVGKTAYLMLIVLTLGTLRHKGRKMLGLPEFAWSYRRHAHDRSFASYDREGDR